MDPNQRLRLRRCGLGLVGALVLTFTCLILYQHNAFRVSLTTLMMMISILWLINLVIFFTILSGLNKKFKDPSLTIIQMIWAIITVMIAAYFAENLRPVLLMFCLNVLLFCSFTASKNLISYIILFSIICYITVLFLLTKTPQATVNVNLELVALLIYTLVALSISVVIREQINRRQYLKYKTDVLGDVMVKLKDHDKDE